MKVDKITLSKKTLLEKNREWVQEEDEINLNPFFSVIFEIMNEEEKEDEEKTE